MAKEDVIKAFAQELKLTVQIIEANKTFFKDKGDVDKALARAKQILEHLGETPAPPAETGELVKKIREFDTKIGELISALDPNMQSSASRCKEIKQEVNVLKAKQTRTSDEDIRITTLEAEDAALKNNLFPALNALIETCKETQTLLEEIIGDEAKYNALKKEVKGVFEKDVPIFLTVQNQISKIYLIIEGQL